MIDSINALVPSALHLQTLTNVVHSPYLELFTLLVLGGVGFPFPEDFTLSLAGFLYACKMVRLVPAYLFVLSGLLLADFILYSAGRRYGKRIVSHKWMCRFVSPDKLAWLQRRFDRWGSLFVLVGRHIPGLRVQLFIISGVMRVPKLKFLITDAVAALFSVTVWGAIGYTGGHLLNFGRMTHIEKPVILVVIVLSAVLALVKYGRGKKWYRAVSAE